MTIHLPADLELSIRAEVLSGKYLSEDAMVAEVVREHLRRHPSPAVEQGEPGSQPDPAPHKSLWESIVELQKAVPEEEWAKLPVDGAEQHDHYIYGSPKRLT